MDRCTYLEIGGKYYPLLMSLAAAEKVNEKYGSMNGLLQKLGDEKECVTTYLDVLELLIAQGCAYKNTFEKDIPTEQGDPVVEGEWVPLAREGIALGVDRRRIGEVAERIAEAAGLSRKNEIEGEAASKKNDKAE